MAEHTPEQMEAALNAAVEQIAAITAERDTAQAANASAEAIIKGIAPDGFDLDGARGDVFVKGDEVIYRPEKPAAAGSDAEGDKPKGGLSDAAKALLEAAQAKQGDTSTTPTGRNVPGDPAGMSQAERNDLLKGLFTPG